MLASIFLFGKKVLNDQISNLFISALCILISEERDLLIVRYKASQPFLSRFFFGKKISLINPHQKNPHQKNLVNRILTRKILTKKNLANKIFTRKILTKKNLVNKILTRKNPHQKNPHQKKSRQKKSRQKKSR